MIEVLQIIATSWPLAVMIIGLAAAIVINRRLKQAMDDSQTLRDIRASQAVTVRQPDRYRDDG